LTVGKVAGTVSATFLPMGQPHDSHFPTLVV
jgi:hypothetical protein